eukprot:SAG11_NODE_738_length_7426_cov_14.966289_3_plen_181_part_00
MPHISGQVRRSVRWASVVSEGRAKCHHPQTRCQMSNEKPPKSGGGGGGGEGPRVTYTCMSHVGGQRMCGLLRSPGQQLLAALWACHHVHDVFVESRRELPNLPGRHREGGGVPQCNTMNSVVNSVAPVAKSGGGGGSTLAEFIPPAKFAGVRDGFFYTHGDKGLGYYSYSTTTWSRIAAF